MLDEQITHAYAAIEIAIGSDKLHARFKINAQLPMPQPSHDRVNKADMGKLLPADQVRPAGSFILARWHLHKLKFSP